MYYSYNQCILFLCLSSYVYSRTFYTDTAEDVEASTILARNSFTIGPHDTGNRLRAASNSGSVCCLGKSGKLAPDFCVLCVGRW